MGPACHCPAWSPDKDEADDGCVGHVLLNHGSVLGSGGLCRFPGCRRYHDWRLQRQRGVSLAFWRQALRVGGPRPLSVALGDSPSLHLPASGGWLQVSFRRRFPVRSTGGFLEEQPRLTLLPTYLSTLDILLTEGI